MTSPFRVVRRGAPGNPGYHAMLAKGRLKPDEMNKLEAAYAQHLEALRIAGEVIWYRLHGFKLRLGDNSFYTPDFNVMAKDGVMECHEVKGGIWIGDAKTKIKVVAELYPFRFVAVQRQTKRDGAGWVREAFG